MAQEPSDEEGEWKFRNRFKPFRGGGMVALQNNKLRMLVREGVGFVKCLGKVVR